MAGPALKLCARFISCINHQAPKAFGGLWATPTAVGVGNGGGNVRRLTDVEKTIFETTQLTANVRSV